MYRLSFLAQMWGCQIAFVTVHTLPFKDCIMEMIRVYLTPSHMDLAGKYDTDVRPCKPLTVYVHEHPNYQHLSS